MFHAYYKLWGNIHSFRELQKDGATTIFVVAVAMLLIVIDIGVFGPKTAKRDLEAVHAVGDNASL
ncbi:hypothetical protein [Alicyclobacillus acidoterrestris]|uniref:Uncharacterized protein n=1 Tax=Alicyclobacillus acidoterrestris (strain ATCC 49025 / DSM 3922 / CIP 106132 / NCIMB 13137 / GD3B) TaxID=1356854 RepID=T0DMM1_ALIAG|nr:hypothetical protein [Alicyclobacillus acidoterrestris]EPZ52562.1 hypothetical protein N007_20440 [Alicyclobacillus acidoterrestris ATCC 49025]UNO47285.1 hypothetical protein K1I37_11115 [Alicyclobacillus acidoterrestris]